MSFLPPLSLPPCSLPSKRAEWRHCGPRKLTTTTTSSRSSGTAEQAFLLAKKGSWMAGSRQGVGRELRHFQIRTKIAAQVVPCNLQPLTSLLPHRHVPTASRRRKVHRSLPLEFWNGILFWSECRVFISSWQGRGTGPPLVTYYAKVPLLPSIRVRPPPLHRPAAAETIMRAGSVCLYACLAALLP